MPSTHVTLAKVDPEVLRAVERIKAAIGILEQEDSADNRRNVCIETRRGKATYDKVAAWTRDALDDETLKQLLSALKLAKQQLEIRNEAQPDDLTESYSGSIQRRIDDLEA